MTKFKTYKSALDWIYKREQEGVKLGLDNIKKLLDLTGNPQNSFPSIHIAGTNGKGSTSVFLSYILSNSGYKIGLLTKPHIKDFRERIRINNEKISEYDIIDIVNNSYKIAEKINVTFFEYFVYLAYEYFKSKNVDISIIEAGLGGRLDATNIINSIICIITNIDFDHTKTLGNRLDYIAFEKASILKPGVKVITAENKKIPFNVIRRMAEALNLNVVKLDDNIKYELIDFNEDFYKANFYSKKEKYLNLKIPLLGEHQLRNSALSILTSEELIKLGYNLNSQTIIKGIENTVWHGRFTLIKDNNRTIIIDVGHNPDGQLKVFKTYNQLYGSKKPLLLIGAVKGKDFESMLKIWKGYAKYFYIAPPDNKRALSLNEMKYFAEKLDLPFSAYDNSIIAIKSALKQKDDNIIITGSFYLAGEIWNYLQKTTKFSSLPSP